MQQLPIKYLSNISLSPSVCSCFMSILSQPQIDIEQANETWLHISYNTRAMLSIRLLNHEFGRITCWRVTKNPASFALARKTKS